MERTSRSVDDYLASLDGQRGDEMRTLDAAIGGWMPGAERHLYEGTFWGGSEQQIVGYGVMDYTNRSGEEVEWFVVGLAAQQRYVSMYVNAVENDAYLLRQYEGKLGRAKIGSASISFATIEDIDFDNLMELVTHAGELTR
jgi:hypothetical protein